MKRGLPIFFICMVILASPVNIELQVQDISSSPMHIAAIDPEIERIYGVDYSQQVFNTISQNSYRDYIIKLTENGSRPVGSPTDLGINNIAARKWIFQELQTISDGRIEVEVLGEYKSVLGKLPGYLPVDAPALMIGGHYDSVSNAPGANDDATGVAAALEIARVMSMFNWPLDIYFGLWNAEEIGLIGSSEVAQIMREREIELLAYYNVDMLLVPFPDAPAGEQVLMAYPVGFYHEGAYWADITRAMSQNYGRHTIRPVISSDFSGWSRSDHYPFWQQGYTALFAHESGFLYDIAYHTPMDAWDNPLYNYQVATDAVRAIGSAMAFTMARTYGEPTSHYRSFTLIPSHERNLTFAISTPTTINVTARWFGGGTSISLYDTNGILLSQRVDDSASPWDYEQIISQRVETQGLYTLHIVNYGGTSVGHEVSVVYETDIDGNEILDSQEYWFDQEYFSMDTDLDTISDAQEMLMGTLRDSDDSDGDSIIDPWEIEYGLDPLDPSDASEDNDSDGVDNLAEFLHNTNPNEPDSDADAMPDLWEIENNLNPNLDDSMEDPDNDAVTNVREFEDGTDPHYAEFRPMRLLVPSLTVASLVIVVLVTIVVIRRRF